MGEKEVPRAPRIPPIPPPDGCRQKTPVCLRANWRFLKKQVPKCLGAMENTSIYPGVDDRDNILFFIYPTRSENHTICMVYSIVSV